MENQQKVYKYDDFVNRNSDPDNKFPKTTDPISGVVSYVYVYTDLDIAFVKVEFPWLGLYINSITVRESPRQPNKLWVQLPAFKTGKRWTKPLELRNDSQLKDIIFRAALRAYCVYFNQVDTDDEDKIEQFINYHNP